MSSGSQAALNEARACLVRVMVRHRMWLGDHLQAVWAKGSRWVLQSKDLDWLSSIFLNDLVEAVDLF